MVIWWLSGFAVELFFDCYVELMVELVEVVWFSFGDDALEMVLVICVV